MNSLAKNKTVILDVRDDIRNGREPFSKIMSVANALDIGDELLVIAPFEPVPLYHVMKRQGFSHTRHSNKPGDWQVRFTRDAAGSPTGTVPSAGAGSGKVIDVDARGLEPPQPMVTILEALNALPAGGALRALTDRRPMHLYAQLEARGFAGETEEQTDGSFLTLIRRT